MVSSAPIVGFRVKECIYVPSRIFTLTFHWPGLWSPGPGATREHQEKDGHGCVEQTASCGMTKALWTQKWAEGRRGPQVMRSPWGQ